MSPPVFTISVVTKIAALIIVASLPSQAAPSKPLVSEEMVKELIAIVINMTGDDCSRFNKCGDHGDCFLGGVCLCEEGYTGDNCSQIYQPLNQTDGEIVTLGTIRETLAAADIWMMLNDISEIQVRWPTRSGILESEARVECEATYGINNRFDNVCSSVMPPEFVRAFIDFCVQDIKIVSQMNYAYVSRLRYLSSCISIIRKTNADGDGNNEDAF